MISQAAESELMQTAFELHNIGLEAVDKVVSDPVLLRLFNIHDIMQKPVIKSWQANQADLQGRFDFSWSSLPQNKWSVAEKELTPKFPIKDDNTASPKLLEYNGDTPSLQLESGILSEEWLEQRRGETIGRMLNEAVEHQANYLNAALKAGMKKIVETSC